MSSEDTSMLASNAAIKADAATPPPVITPVTKPAVTAASKAARTARRFEQAYGVLNVAGLSFLVPIIRMLRGENPRGQLKDLWRLAGVPIVAILVFLMLWSQMSSRIVTSLGTIPGPSAVWDQVGVLWADHKAERDKRTAFYERQTKRNADRLAEDATVHRSDHDQLAYGIHRFCYRFSVRHSTRHLVRPESDDECRYQPIRADLQTGIAVGVAATGHHGGQRHVCHR
jgi:hypothetical protein